MSRDDEIAGRGGGGRVAVGGPGVGGSEGPEGIGCVGRWEAGVVGRALACEENDVAGAGRVWG